MIKVAVISARENTSFEPLCIFDGESKPDTISWLEKQRVPVIRAQVPFRAELFSEVTIEANKGTPYRPEQASGAFLRIISPHFVDDEHFLYTDCDVMFANELSGVICLPKYFAASEERQNDGSFSVPADVFNSGVMLINSAGFNAREDAIVSFIRNNNFYDRENSSYDQSMLNLIFKGEWDRLAPECNWRPFQGINDRASIVHFHGPKPHRIAAILDGKAEPYEREKISGLVFEQRDSYAHYLRDFNRYLSLSSSK
jgi:lipopolysaccharide biosynthesis glycosyltransferase